MTEEESGSVFGGIADAAEAAWDAQANVTGAIIDTAIGVSEFGTAMSQKAIATAAEMVSADETRDNFDNAMVDSRDAAYDSFSSAGEQLSNAYTDIVGE